MSASPVRGPVTLRLVEDPEPFSPPLGLDALLDLARDGLDRLEPDAAARAIEEGALLVDIRPEAQRRREGEIPGSILIDRNVLEWRLAPSSTHRIPELVDADQTVIISCSQGFASSLAAATLRQLGLRNATDLVGGFLAWEAEGLPVAPFGREELPTRTAPVGP